MDDHGPSRPTADEIALLGSPTLSGLLSPPAWLGRDDPSAELLPLAGLLVRAVRPRRVLALEGAGASFVAALAEAMLADWAGAELVATLPEDPDHAAGLEALFAARFRGVGRLTRRESPVAPDAPTALVEEADLLVIDAGTAEAPSVRMRLSTRGMAVLRRARRGGADWRAIAEGRPSAWLPHGDGTAIVVWGEAAPPAAFALVSAIGREDAIGGAVRRNLGRLGAWAGWAAPIAQLRPAGGIGPSDEAAAEELRRRLAEALVARDRAQRAQPLASEQASVAAKLARLERLEGEREVLLGWLRRSAGEAAELAELAAAAGRETGRLEARLVDCARQSERARELLQRDRRDRRWPGLFGGLGDGRGSQLDAAVAELFSLEHQARNESAAEGRIAGSPKGRPPLEPELAALLVGRHPGPEVRPPPDPGWQQTRRIRSVLFVAGEPEQPGAELRTRRLASICARSGRTVRSLPLAEVGPDAIAGIDLLVLWRAAWSEHVATMIGLVRQAGGLVAFDVDDLVTEPSLARVETIDGMRTQAIAPLDLAHLFERFRQVAASVDACVATTEELAGWLRLLCDRVFVVPNGFDDPALDDGRLAVRRTRFERRKASNAVRIGYAAGSATHQRDFAQAAAGIARAMRARPETRLVLFRAATGPTLRIDEFEEFAGLAERIEWRDAVPLDRLADEIARFDVAIAPLETGNPFCEAKSELKWIDAAVCSVPCIASPTGPFSRLIRHGETGLLAADAQSWEACLLSLVDDAELRTRVGRQAHADALWRFGARRCGELLEGVLRCLEGGARAAVSAELAIRRGSYAGFGLPAVPDTETLFEADRLALVDVAVVITSFNYAEYLEEALDSVARQTLEGLELVVVDDGSTDGSVALLERWAQANAARFGRIALLRTRRNAGLGPARNAGFAHVHARHVMVLDADNRLGPECCETLHRIIEMEDCAFAFSTLTQFGEATHDLSALDFDPWRLVPGNSIDAMALVARWAWSAAGGYYDNPSARGWEDFDLWCRLVELGQRGVRHRTPLAEYRVHAGSMTNSVTEQENNKRQLVAFLEGRHPWLRLRSREAASR